MDCRLKNLTCFSPCPRRYDLQRGVYRVLEALEGDRRELARLQRKAVEMRRRQMSGRVLDGEEDELRSLLLGAADLERKLNRTLEEVGRLAAKTEQLIGREQERDEWRRRHLAEEARKNQALQLLIRDMESLDGLLRELTDVRKQYTKAEGIHRQMRSLMRASRSGVEEGEVG
jgi:hypothetical protein